MDSTQIIGYILAVLVGVLLGMLGSGGSILSVPILVYVMKVEPVLATAYSLFTVGTTALIGGFQKAKQKLVDFRKVFLFGIPTVISVFLTRKVIVPSIPEVLFFGSFNLEKSVLIMTVFAIVMIFASYRMLKPIKLVESTNDTKINYFKTSINGVLIGLIAGFVGAGGGFLIVPALIFLFKTPMKTAVGTSLFIVSVQSLIGFLGDLQSNQIIDWKLLLYFTICSIIGVFIGNIISKKIPAKRLSTGFGWFVLLMGIYIIFKEIILK